MKKALVTVFLAVLSVATLHAGSVVKNNEGRNRTNLFFCSGVLDYIGGQYESSKATLEDLVLKGTENPWVYFYLGNIHYGNNDFAKAVAYYDKAKKLESGNYWFWEAYTNAYIRTVSEKEAIEALEQLAQRKKDDFSIQMKIAALLLRIGETQEAEKRIDSYREKGIELTPECYEMLAQSALASDNDSLALKYYNCLLELAPNDILAVYGKAEIFRCSNSMEDFRANAVRFFSSDKVPLEAKREYYEFLVNKQPQDYLNANKACYDSVTVAFVQSHPSDSTALNLSGLYYLHNGDIDLAKTSFLVNATVNCDNSKWAYYHLSLLDYLKEYGEKAHYAEIYYRKYGDLGFRWSQMQAYVSDDKLFPAIDIVKEFIKGTKNKQEIAALTSFLGDLYHTLASQDSVNCEKYTKTSFSCYEKAISLDKTSPLAYNNYAYFLALRKENLSYALKLSKKACDLERNNATYLDTLGYIYYLQGNFTKSKEIFLKALGFGGKEEAVIVEHYADVLTALGEISAAKYYYDLAQKLTK